ncbi:MAG: hypothetical protein FWH36_02050 [Lentimicrobiaceae bacterium]|nr:hypothetical protein [Lentimicrobiaceae bacterium]
METNIKTFLSASQDLPLSKSRLPIGQVKTSCACLIALLFCINNFAFGQNDDITYHQAPNTVKNEPKNNINEDYLQRISVGGTGGFSVGHATYIEVSPHAAYHFNEIFCVGLGGTYTFYYDNFYKYSNHIFGARLFSEAHFLNFLGVHATYRALNYENPTYLVENERIWSNNLSLGGGYYQRSGRLAVYFYVLYNWSDRPPQENIYNFPVLFEAGFTFFLK